MIVFLLSLQLIGTFTCTTLAFTFTPHISHTTTTTTATTRSFLVHRRPNAIGIRTFCTFPQSSTPLTSLASTASPRIDVGSIQKLNSDGFIVLPDFLSPKLVSALRNDIGSLRSKGKFNIARIGQDGTNALNTDIRIAETCFLGKNKLSDVKDDARDELYDVLDNLRSDLSGNELLDEKDASTGELIRGAAALDESLSELLYAYYPTGGFYRRHTDSVANSASVLRTYSLLIYLNDEWKESDGGCLRMHLDGGKDFLPEGEQPNFIDVNPEGGTLVLFKSDKVPHEVLDTNSERMAIVGWYNRPVSSADISSLASEGDKLRGIMLLVAAGLVTYGVVSIIAG